MSPHPMTIPYIHGYTTGLLWKWFKLSGSIQWPISTFFHGAVGGGMAVAIFYRWWLLLPLSSLWPKLPKFFRKATWIYGTDVSAYITAAFVCAPISGLAFLPYDVSTKILHEHDPSYVIPPGSQVLGGIWADVWGGSLAVIVLTTMAGGQMLVWHCNYILKNAATSSQTKTMHKEAIRTLIVQGALMWGPCALPTFMLATGLIYGVEKFPQWYSDFVATFGLALFSAKSINCSIAILTTVKVFRNVILQFLHLQAPSTGITPLPSTST